MSLRCAPGRLGFFLLLPLLAGCGVAGVAPAGARDVPPTPEMISRAAATAVCPLIDGKLYTLSVLHGEATDAYLWVRQCQANVRPRGLTLRASAIVWAVVDRDVGPVHLEQFVHATVSIDVAYDVTATYRSDHAEVSLRPLAAPRVDVEAVGTLDPQPLNWAALAADTLVPALGTTSEWVAKRAARAEGIKALTAALATELRVGLDAQHDRLWFGAAAPAAPMSSPTRQVVRVAARGTALIGPFDGDVEVAVSGVSGAPRVVAEPMCPEDVERILARDRRSDAVDAGSWLALESGTKVTVNGPPSCPWMLAMRTLGAESATVDLDARSAGAGRGSKRGLAIAASIESITVDPSLANADVDIWLVGGDERVRVYSPSHRTPEPHVFILPSDGRLLVRSTLRGESQVLSEAALVILAPGGEQRVVVKDHEGNPGTVTIRTRVFAAPSWRLQRAGAGGALRP
jgi:hypothetical protein